MAKTKVSDWSATPSENTDIDSINIAEGCAPSGINNAIREVMAQVKDFQAGTNGDPFNGPIGTDSPAPGAFTTLTSSSTTTLNGTTIPASSTLVTLTGTQTLTNKTLTSPTMTAPVLGTPASGTVTNLTGTASININGTVGATTASTGAFTTLAASGAVTLSGGTANGVAYLNGSKVLTTGSALTFDGTNLGIGTSSPTFKLDVNGGDIRITDTFPSLVLNGTTGGVVWNFIEVSSGNLETRANDVTRMSLTASGNLGLGVTPSAWNAAFDAVEFAAGSVSSISTTELDIPQNAYFGASSWQYKNTNPATYYQQNLGVHRWYTAPSGTAGNAISFRQAMTLDASGNLLVATTDIDPIASATNGMSYFKTNSTLRIRTAATAIAIGTAVFSELQQFYYWNGSSNTKIGSISNNGTTTGYNTSSDYRLKNTIAPMTCALAKVALLKPCTYKWNADGSDGEGFIAHELAEVVPQCVTGEKDAVDAEGNPQYQGIDTSFLVATLTAAIQEQQAIIEDMKTRLAAAGI